MRRLRAASQQLILFAGASLAYGIGTSIFDSTFNNFLNEKFTLSGFQRSFLEFSPELPGFLRCELDRQGCGSILQVIWTGCADYRGGEDRFG